MQSSMTVMLDVCGQEICLQNTLWIEREGISSQENVDIVVTSTKATVHVAKNKLYLAELVARKLNTHWHSKRLTEHRLSIKTDKWFGIYACAVEYSSVIASGKVNCRKICKVHVVTV